MILFTACEADPGVSGELGFTAGEGSQEKTGASSQSRDSASETAGSSENPENPDSPDDMDSNVQYYQDGTLLSAGKLPDFERDVKKLAAGPSGKQLTDYPKGYEITFPDSMEVDFGLSPDYR